MPAEFLTPETISHRRNQLKQRVRKLALVIGIAGAALASREGVASANQEGSTATYTKDQIKIIHDNQYDANSEYVANGNELKLEYKLDNQGQIIIDASGMNLPEGSKLQALIYRTEADWKAGPQNAILVNFDNEGQSRILTINPQSPDHIFNLFNRLPDQTVQGQAFAVVVGVANPDGTFSAEASAIGPGMVSSTVEPHTSTQPMTTETITDASGQPLQIAYPATGPSQTGHGDSPGIDHHGSTHSLPVDGDGASMGEVDNPISFSQPKNIEPPVAPTETEVSTTPSVVEPTIEPTIETIKVIPTTIATQTPTVEATAINTPTIEATLTTIPTLTPTETPTQTATPEPTSTDQPKVEITQSATSTPDASTATPAPVPITTQTSHDSDHSLPLNSFGDQPLPIQLAEAGLLLGAAGIGFKKWRNQDQKSPQEITLIQQLETNLSQWIEVDQLPQAEIKAAYPTVADYRLDTLENAWSSLNPAQRSKKLGDIIRPLLNSPIIPIESTPEPASIEPEPAASLSEKPRSPFTTTNDIDHRSVGSFNRFITYANNRQKDPLKPASNTWQNLAILGKDHPGLNPSSLSRTTIENSSPSEAIDWDSVFDDFIIDKTATESSTIDAHHPEKTQDSDHQATARQNFLNMLHQRVDYLSQPEQNSRTFINATFSEVSHTINTEDQQIIEQIIQSDDIQVVLNWVDQHAPYLIGTNEIYPLTVDWPIANLQARQNILTYYLANNPNYVPQTRPTDPLESSYSHTQTSDNPGEASPPEIASHQPENATELIKDYKQRLQEEISQLHRTADILQELAPTLATNLEQTRQTLIQAEQIFQSIQFSQQRDEVTTLRQATDVKLAIESLQMYLTVNGQFNQEQDFAQFYTQQLADGKAVIDNLRLVAATLPNQPITSDTGVNIPVKSFTQPIRQLTGNPNLNQTAAVIEAFYDQSGSSNPESPLKLSFKKIIEGKRGLITTSRKNFHLAPEDEQRFNQACQMIEDQLIDLEQFIDHHFTSEANLGDQLEAIRRTVYAFEQIWQEQSLAKPTLKTGTAIEQTDGLDETNSLNSSDEAVEIEPVIDQTQPTAESTSEPATIIDESLLSQPKKTPELETRSAESPTLNKATTDAVERFISSSSTLPKTRAHNLIRNWLAKSQFQPLLTNDKFNHQFVSYLTKATQGWSTMSVDQKRHVFDQVFTGQEPAIWKTSAEHIIITPRPVPPKIEQTFQSVEQKIQADRTINRLDKITLIKEINEAHRDVGSLFQKFAEYYTFSNWQTEIEAMIEETKQPDLTVDQQQALYQKLVTNVTALGNVLAEEKQQLEQINISLEAHQAMLAGYPELTPTIFEPYLSQRTSLDRRITNWQTWQPEIKQAYERLRSTA